MSFIVTFMYQHQSRPNFKRISSLKYYVLLNQYRIHFSLTISWGQPHIMRVKRNFVTSAIHMRTYEEWRKALCSKKIIVVIIIHLNQFIFIIYKKISARDFVKEIYRIFMDRLTESIRKYIRISLHAWFALARAYRTKRRPVERPALFLGNQAWIYSVGELPNFLSSFFRSSISGLLLRALHINSVPSTFLYPKTDSTWNYLPTLTSLKKLFSVVSLKTSSKHWSFHAMPLIFISSCILLQSQFAFKSILIPPPPSPKLQYVFFVRGTDCSFFI